MEGRAFVHCLFLWKISSSCFSIWFHVILTIEYGRNENIHIITSDNPLYFVMRREALNDKIQWIIGYIPWPKGMEYITKMNEWMIPNKIFWTSRIKIWIHTKWIVRSTRYGFTFLWGMFRKFYEELFLSLFLSGDVIIWVSSGFNGVYYLYSSNVTNTVLFCTVGRFKGSGGG